MGVVRRVENPDAELAGHKMVKEGLEERIDGAPFGFFYGNLSVHCAQSIDDYLLLFDRWQEGRERLQLCRVDASQVCCLVSDREEVCLPVGTLSQVGQELREDHAPVGSNGKDVVLMDAAPNFAVPDEPATQFVKVPTLR